MGAWRIHWRRSWSLMVHTAGLIERHMLRLHVRVSRVTQVMCLQLDIAKCGLFSFARLL